MSKPPGTPNAPAATTNRETLASVLCLGRKRGLILVAQHLCRVGGPRQVKYLPIVIGFVDRFVDRFVERAPKRKKLPEIRVRALTARTRDRLKTDPAHHEPR